MSPESLEIFLDLSRSLHFGRTARARHISPSALSRAIQRLEQEAGAALFERDNRRVVLTAAGQRFRQYASESVARWRALREELQRSGQSLGGTLSLFCSATAAQSFLPAILSRFRQAHPGVTLRLETGYAVDALQQLEQDAVDVTVAALPARLPRDLATRIVTHTPLLFVGPAAPCEVRTQVLERAIDWARVPMVLPQFGIARESVDRWFRARRLKPRVYGEVAGNEAILTLVSLGCGVGIVPGLVLEKSPLRADVEALPVRPALPEFRVGLATRYARLDSPVVSAFWESV